MKTYRESTAMKTSSNPPSSPSTAAKIDDSFRMLPFGKLVNSISSSQMPTGDEQAEPSVIYICVDSSEQLDHFLDRHHEAEFNNNYDFTAFSSAHSGLQAHRN